MKRELSTKLKTLILDRSDPRVIILEGARQVGKSTMVKDILKGFSTPVSFFDLEKDRSFSRKLDATEDFNDFKVLLQDQCGVQEEGLLVIDEAQESRRLAGYIKSFKEDWPQLKVLLTGSSMNRFFGPDVRIPVGRTQSLCLFGFSFTEFVEMVKGPALSDFIRSAPSSVPPSRHALLLELFDQYLKVGGYPETVKAFAAGAPYRDVTSEIMSDCEEDFERKEAYQPELFRGIINGVANYIGSPSKLTHFPATKYHATRALEAMKAWHLVLEVEPRSVDPLRSHFLPKRYLHDLGVINQSRTISVPQVSLITTIEPVLRTPLGGMFENAVLIGLLSGQSAKHRIGTWKKGSNTDIEVDFVMDTCNDQRSIPIECKAATVLKKKHYKNLLHYLRLMNQRIGCCVTAAPLETITTADALTILNLPIYLVTPDNIATYSQREAGAAP